MKKTLIAGFALVVLVVAVIVFKAPNQSPNPVDQQVAGIPSEPLAPQTTDQPEPVAPTASVAAIETYIQKNPSGRGVAPLRRLSSAIKARPAQNEAIAATVARSVEDGTISKEEAAMLEQAATLAEDQGLSPQQMAEFSRQYAQGVGLESKPVSAPTSQEVKAAPLANFDGKRQLTYNFTGTAQCDQKPCANVRVRVRLTSGQWAETREDVTDGQGHYSLKVPVLSTMDEKVSWQIEAYSKALQKAELSGGRTTTSGDRDVEIQNDLVLNPS